MPAIELRRYRVAEGKGKAVREGHERDDTMGGTVLRCIRLGGG